MPYSFTKNDADPIAKALEKYYDDAWEQGIKGLFDKMAQANMGLVTGYIDKGKDTYAGLKKKSADSWKTTFKAKLKLQAKLYVGNRNDIYTQLVTLGEKAIEKLAEKIPVPLVGTIITKLSGVGAEAARDELHQRSIAEADGQIVKATGGPKPKDFFVSDKEAMAFIENAIKQYKEIGKYATTLPATISTFDDAVTFPQAVFKMQQATSKLNVALWSITDYMTSMSERLTNTQDLYKQYKIQLRSSLPDAVMEVVNGAYRAGYNKGLEHVNQQKYGALPEPVFRAANSPGLDGGATLLAERVAWATSHGYYDAGNQGPIVTRGRSRTVYSRGGN